MVKWTKHAKRQLRHIHDYIAQDSSLYARRISEELVKTTLGLDELPRKGRRVPELNEDAVRELGLYSYRILYEIKSDQLIEVRKTPDNLELLARLRKFRGRLPEGFRFDRLEEHERA